MSSIAEKFIQTDLESPRWKQLFAFLTQADSEEALDQIMRDMTMDGYMERIQCPVLLTAGEYDPRAPLHEVYRLFDQLWVPAELWVMVDQHHELSIGPGGPLWSRTTQGIGVDWLRDRLEGNELRNPGVSWVLGADGPNAPSVTRKRHWYEEAQ
jgi:pimeloyl-ACP methyl ester carboxylesterase